MNFDRSDLFQMTGAVSCQSIAPVIPLAYVPENTAEGLVDHIPQREIPPMGIGQIAWSAQAMSAAVDWAIAWRSVLVECSVLAAPPGLPPPLTGIFLGGPDAAEAWEELPVQDREHSRERWESTMPGQVAVLHVELLVLHFGNRNRWWDEVDWEVRWSRRIKLRGQTVAT